MSYNLRKYENLHVTLWLVKDTCWVCDLKIAGIIMLVPTVLFAFHIAWKSQHDVADLFHNIAVCCWIIANGIWMIGEFFLQDTTRPFAIIFFIVGLLVVATYYIFVMPRINRRNLLS